MGQTLSLTSVVREDLRTKISLERGTDCVRPYRKLKEFFFFREG